MADETVPARPVFVLCDGIVPAGDTLTDTEGREWVRAVYGSDGVCAAETPDGRVLVWDAEELFRSLFRAVEERPGG